MRPYEETEPAIRAMMHHGSVFSMTSAPLESVCSLSTFADEDHESSGRHDMEPSVAWVELGMHQHRYSQRENCLKKCLVVIVGLYSKGKCLFFNTTGACICLRQITYVKANASGTGWGVNEALSASWAFPFVKSEGGQLVDRRNSYLAHVVWGAFRRELPVAGSAFSVRSVTCYGWLAAFPLGSWPYCNVASQTFESSMALSGLSMQ